MLAGAALVGIFLNQLSFVYAIKLTTATTVALLFGTLPVMTGDLRLRCSGSSGSTRRFWLAAVLAFSGAALVALGSGSGVSGQLWGDLLGFAASATWACVHGRGLAAAAPLLDRCGSAPSPSRSGRSRCCSSARRSWRARTTTSPATIWLLLAFAVVGPLVVANLLWFGGDQPRRPVARRRLREPQPFLAAVFALLILSEPLGRLQVAAAS